MKDLGHNVVNHSMTLHTVQLYCKKKKKNKYYFALTTPPPPPHHPHHPPYLALTGKPEKVDLYKFTFSGQAMGCLLWVIGSKLALIWGHDTMGLCRKSLSFCHACWLSGFIQEHCQLKVTGVMACFVIPINKYTKLNWNSFSRDRWVSARKT